ncbi:MAG: DUF1987 domain-containing protein [Bacteroidales bacterium]|jgi:predicted deacetylase|nr:DUF1987 domain-containing protein [Bacteroidales bacterium]MBP5501774.1 DUF1987 domain-containing protein [Bacteroidales bacterium]MBQ1884439.1 DUF1987 domain-containing protein [Bacteroidales bacterium]MBR6176971.1 DUF1987 domain-containing protein [Bacteroidales bacterium]MDD6000991.1 DUF1987 domain-containing protein [Bacteroidales bacterium]
METIKITGNMKTPSVLLDPETGVLELAGRSIPENTESLYKPLLEWVEEYVKDPKPTTTVNIKFEYFNSSSAKYLIRFLEFVTQLKKQGKNLIINWYYDDDELFEYGQDYQDVLEMKFNFIATQEFQNK